MSTGRVKLVWPDGRLVRWMAAALAGAYGVCVLALAAAKAASPVLEALPWPEVFYGPALTALSALALVCVGETGKRRGNGDAALSSCSLGVSSLNCSKSHRIS